MSEHLEQCAVIQWARMHRDKRLHTLLFAIPNGGQRHPGTARKLKAEGVVAGIPDLFLAIPARGFRGLFIEMKHGKNRPTKNQIDRMTELMKEKYLCVVCYSAERAITWIEAYLDRSNSLWVEYNTDNTSIFAPDLIPPEIRKDVYGWEWKEKICFLERDRGG